ncbi:glyoxalase/bleomycin resistance/extradiol dioxygenase family protein [Vagococcus sp. BWB3-3]|uniref:Glyoxalase/bleomycin resistance/extradiol dioxygenase family protein n=1 Tax=Vagococcus allomyrinae TaxID=2794353 RepID=A0A940SUF0_9ENTE|nr:glyoxalase/bleomycin resistance/extradiol dioxygenase family protein [Vagococcus allomyrinae]MBP1040709.1 glyoxalase/bleomycin resistance/extradiol dioxygenase family protein [Vagococcus allomyrinae]
MIKTGTPYLYFYDECNDALNYYVDIFGAEIVEKATFEDVEYMEDESRKNCIAYASFKLGESVVLANDFLEKKSKEHEAASSQTSIWLELEKGADIKLLEDKMLATGSKSLTKLEETFWDSFYAKVEDKFGIIWELNAQK